MKVHPTVSKKTWIVILSIFLFLQKPNEATFSLLIRIEAAAKSNIAKVGIKTSK
jgi:hypothetical protein